MLKHEIYSRMIEPFSIFQHLHPFKTHQKFNPSPFSHQNAHPKKSPPTWKAIRQNKLGVVLLAGGEVAAAQGVRTGGNFVSCGETVGFLEHVYKKSGWEQFQGCFFYFFCSLLVFRSELEYDIMEAVVCFFFSWISYFSLESDFVLEMGMFLVLKLKGGLFKSFQNIGS